MVKPEIVKPAITGKEKFKGYFIYIIIIMPGIYMAE